KTSSGWSFNGIDLYLVKEKTAWPELTNISAVQGESGLSIAATYFRSQDLIDIATMFLDVEQLEKTKLYQLNKLAGDFYNSTLFLPVDGIDNIGVSTVFENFDFSIPDTEIAFSGVDGELSYVKGQARIELLSEMVGMDFGSLFRQPLDADLIEGVIFASRAEGGWHIEMQDFYLLNSDIEINTRIKLLADDQGTMFADIQSDFKNAHGAAIGKYYPLPMMSKELLNWLDMAVTDGYVESGSFIMHGDLAGFPYADHDGVMEVVFDMSYLTLKFLEGWPSLNDLSSHIRFHNSSMFINQASGQTYRGEMTEAEVHIPDLNAPRLFINGHVEAPAEDLQHYVWDSGLKSILGTAMKQFQASGDTGLDLELEIPLDSGDTVQARGVLQFKETELYLPLMDYVLNDVSGRLYFENERLSAKGIKAVFDGEPLIIGVSSIDVSEVDRFSANMINMGNLFAEEDIPRSEMVFNIKGRLPADGLLKKFEWIPEGWVSGASDWDVDVHLPKETEDYSVRVEMESELEGTAINLSKAVSKKVNESLPVKLEIQALYNGLQIDAKSDKNFSVFATRNDENIWDFVVDSSLIRGSGEFAEDLNKNSTASLDLEYIDLLALFKPDAGKGGDSMSLKSTFFPSLNFKTKTLLWNDWKFSDAKLETSWHSHGMLIDLVSLQGPSLQIDGHGSWLSSWQNAHESNFNFNVKSDDLGRTLAVLNLTKNVKHCEYTAKVNWRWFDEPYRFSWQTVQGNSHFTMKEGEIKAMDPGAGGRIVGLLNVFKLFDRLTLDFKDVAGEGFAFDLVEGDFEFRDGHAMTENIEVNAAAANMKMTGNVGMVDRDYDLRMRVKPRTSAATFTGGTLAGGPVLGAGLVLINKLFGLEESTYDEYEITGAWDDPQIEQVEKRSVDAEVEPEDEE
ncbi:MAG: DUF3971 domain-containing protein, partial [Gammaproteobacteria bacterium]|nr:DUF3971 domain-containing protein [Gammaproteobacteria bacterium]